MVGQITAVYMESQRRYNQSKTVSIESRGRNNQSKSSHMVVRWYNNMANSLEYNMRKRSKNVKYSKDNCKSPSESF